ncbi:MAG: hypothetical protein Fur0044_19810 [Anaerolineae bacterium]|nr:PD-(D/E)XK nuclease family protein [Anaerolineales bacterium]MCQ3976401.1 hypothetical protein [Anaerolineae bacterium]
MNIFSVLALRDEKYHNRMLAWLLDPQESHNFEWMLEFTPILEEQIVGNNNN